MERLASCRAELRRAWQHVHVFPTGKYSIERLFALAQYVGDTSRTRAVMVCILSVAPPLVSILFLDALPLQDPAEGWRANTTVWVRSFVGSLMLTFGVGMLGQALVPRAQLTVLKVVGVALLAATGYVGALLVIAAHWVFPIPFTIVVGVPPWSLFFYAGMVLAVGPRRIWEDRELRLQGLRFANMMSFQAVFLVIYPLYNAVFLSLSQTGQFVLILVLPALKYVLKRLLGMTLGKLDDLVPMVAISVDLFNALYQSKCMRSAGSWWTTLGIILVDVAQNAATLHRISRDLREIEAVAGAEAIRSQGVLGYATALVQQMNALNRAKAFGSLQVQSYINLELSATKLSLLRSIVRKQISESRQRRRSFGLRSGSGYREWLPLTQEVLRHSRIMQNGTATASVDGDTTGPQDRKD
ncbi:hypothetical protein PybrP1_006169 [[Pythium] brassicae (nom. inval.)]|nr:hypothetical protein PybrP1_006169 [[Pythium] brassicae (nom. inval.)]